MNPGVKWEPSPTPVNDHDFRSDADGIGIPYGIYANGTDPDISRRVGHFEGSPEGRASAPPKSRPTPCSFCDPHRLQAQSVRVAGLNITGMGGAEAPPFQTRGDKSGLISRRGFPSTTRDMLRWRQG
ncbi:MAG: hypothetical protein ACLQOO_07370 [Terriglobia bacterium]